MICYVRIIVAIMDNARKKVDNLVMKIKELLAKEESKG